MGLAILSRLGHNCRKKMCAERVSVRASWSVDYVESIAISLEIYMLFHTKVKKVSR